MAKILVQGCGDVGSAVAHVLFCAGHSVVLHDSPRPPHLRRHMAFANALFEGEVMLEGVLAKRVKAIDSLPIMAQCRRAVPVAAQEIESVRLALAPGVIVDARMRKRRVPESQRGSAKLVIGLGPNFCAGQNADIAIETSWGERMGEIVRAGPTMALSGEPRDIGGYRRERFVYAAAGGTFRTDVVIGCHVAAGEAIGWIEGIAVHAPLTGILRGLTHDGAEVEQGTKIVEIDPQSDVALLSGLGARPRRIAEGVLKAVEGAGA